MAIKAYQPGIIPVGHFDVLDTDLSSLKGGEVVVFDSILASLMDKAAPDIYSNDGMRSALRLATPLDQGPFFLANIEDRASATSPGFEVTTLYGRNQSFAQTFDASSKVSIFTHEGFYAVSSTVVDTATINTSTEVHSRLYVSADGQITTEPSGSGAIIGFFIDYRLGSILRSRKLQALEAFSEGDSVIIYKTNADGYLNLNFLSSYIGQRGTLGSTSDGTYGDGYVGLTGSTVIADALDQLNEIVFDLSQKQIGIPSDTSYDDGYISFNFNTTVADAVDQLNEVVFELAKKEIGIPTDGSYDDGYITFSYNTTIANALDSLNEVVAGLSAKKIGIPTDGTFSDGYFGLTFNTTTADAVDALNEEVKQATEMLFPPGHDGYLLTDRGGWVNYSPINLKSNRSALSLPITRVSSNYRISENDYTAIVTASAGPVALLLPTASTYNQGQIFVVKKIDLSGNTVTISVVGGGTIDGGTSVILSTPLSSYTLQSSGSEWFVISDY